VIVAQLGADSHRDDPLSHLDTTVAGQYANARALVSLAEELCGGGRIVAIGGGGYDAYSATPRAWACVLAALLGVEPPPTLPEEWRRAATLASDGGVTPPPCTFDEHTAAPPDDAAGRALAGTRDAMERLRTASPLLGQED